ncbi:hypothetical protein GZH49_37795 [Nocardia terpenica]
MSPVRPTFLQVDHLRASAAGPVESTYLGMVTTIGEALDLDVLVAVIADFVAAHDGLRTWFDRDDPQFARHVVDSSVLEFEATELPDPVTGPDWTADLMQYFEVAVSPFAWPGLATAAIPGSGGFDLVFVADHAFSDGISQALAALELGDRYRERLAGRTTVRRAASGSSLEYAAYERVRAGGAVADDVYPYWERALGDAHFRLPKPMFDLGVASGERCRRRLRTWTLLDPQQTRAFDAAIVQRGATMSMALFGALALAEYELTARERFWSLNVLATRFGPRFATTQGWLCNFVPVSFTIPVRPDFAGTSSAARNALECGRRMSVLPAQAAVARLLNSGRGGELVEQEPNFVTLLDLRQPAAAQSPGADTRIFTADGTTSAVSIWVGRNESEYFLTVGAPDTPIAWRQLSDYARRLRHVLVTIAITGDYCSERALTAGSGSGS